MDPPQRETRLPQPPEDRDDVARDPPRDDDPAGPRRPAEVPVRDRRPCAAAPARRDSPHGRSAGGRPSGPARSSRRSAARRSTRTATETVSRPTISAATRIKSSVLWMRARPRASDVDGRSRLPSEPRKRAADAGRRKAAGHGRGEGRTHDVRRAPHLATARPLLAPRRRDRSRRESAATGSPPTATRVTGRRRPAPSRSARRCTGTRRIPACAFAYRRLRCGDWWNEDPRSPTYNSFQHVTCGTKPPFVVTTPGMWEQPLAYPHLAIVEYNMHPVVPGRGLGDLPPRPDRPCDERLRQPPARASSCRSCAGCVRPTIR